MIATPAAATSEAISEGTLFTQVENNTSPRQTSDMSIILLHNVDFTEIDTNDWSKVPRIHLDSSHSPEPSCDCINKATDVQSTLCLNLHCRKYYTLTECNNQCPSKDSCGNQRISTKKWKEVAMIQTTNKGYGLKNVTDIMEMTLSLNIVVRPYVQSTGTTKYPKIMPTLYHYIA